MLILQQTDAEPFFGLYLVIMFYNYKKPNLFIYLFFLIFGFVLMYFAKILRVMIFIHIILG